MKILLIGHSIIDHIFQGGVEVIYPGGIFYSALGMKQICSLNDEIYLATGYNSATFYLFKKIYSRTNIDYSFELEKLPEVYLILSEGKEREETYLNLSCQLSLDKILNLNSFDGILINMITGYDISLDQLTKLRKNFRGIIYFDLHTLSRGVDNKLNRYFRVVPNIENWLKKVDILQVNENEFRTIKNSTDDEILTFVFENGVKILVLTRGASGAEAFFKDSDMIKKIYVSSKKIDVKNTVGCGDIFGATFFYSYLCSENIESALKNAVQTSNDFASKTLVEKEIK
jgi:hypothetical protein